MMLRLIPALIFPLLAAASALAGPQEDLPDFKSTIDGSIRWLRSTQNPENGSYGGGVEGTAWVLIALKESPRNYERADGPMVANALDYLLGLQGEEGSILDENAETKAEKIAQTSAAAAALSLHVDDESAPALGRAVLWLGQQGVDGPTVDLIELPADKAEATKVMRRILAGRKADGSYDGPRGAVIETARATEALSRLKTKLSPPKAKADKAVAALPRYEAATKEQMDAAILRGARFLLQSGDGARWGMPGRPDAGLTAMAVGALQVVPEPRPKDIQLAIDDASAWLLSLQKEDGSIHEGRMMNYVTSASIMALAGREDAKAALDKARKYLATLQADEGEGYSDGDIYYGGIGYGSDERPDLSNLQMAIEAMVAAGATEDDPALQRALKFLERCQNRSETNDIEIRRDGIVIKSGDDGGAGYAPGESKAGHVVLADGTKVPRSYGSMTYALLKCYALAGLPADDPRMKDALAWLSKNYTLDVNPGFPTSKDPLAPYQGLFYYYNTMGKALTAAGVDAITTPDGKAHDWRGELAGRVVSLQSKADGSWVNQNAPRWWEGNPVLATSYALLTLGSTRGQ